MTENILGVLVLVAMVLISVVFTIASKIWNKRKAAKIAASVPTSWTNIGEAPIGVEIALQVIKEQLPGWTGNYGGVIEWVKGPFMIQMFDKQVSAAGTVTNFNLCHVKVMYFEDVSQSALAHEIFHVYQEKYNGNKIADGDPQLYSWVNETNRRIKSRL